MELEALNTKYINYAYVAFLSFDEAVACVGSEEVVLNIQSEVMQQYFNTSVGEVGNTGHSSMFMTCGAGGGDMGSASSFGGCSGGDGGGGGGGGGC